MITKIIIAAILAHLTFVSTDAKEPRIDFILVRDSLVVVPVTLNGRGGYKFLLDTGATNSILSSQVADQLGLPAHSRATLLTAGGNLLVTVRTVKIMQIGNIQITNMDIAVADADLFKQLHVDGIIGADYLKQFKVSIDYAHRTLTIKP
jgi:clan AA aspartic protease (TIGR02281 family)